MAAFKTQAIPINEPAGRSDLDLKLRISCIQEPVIFKEIWWNGYRSTAPSPVAVSQDSASFGTGRGAHFE
jgi:hypothetical protein